MRQGNPRFPTSCTHPLMSQGFDFNRCIYDGVPFMPVRQRDELLRQVGTAARGSAVYGGARGVYGGTWRGVRRRVGRCGARHGARRQAVQKFGAVPPTQCA